MNTILAEVQPQNVTAKESAPRSELHNEGSKRQKFSRVLSQEMRQDRKLSAPTEHPQVVDNKAQKLDSGENIKVGGGLVNDEGMSLTWLQHLADQELSITAEAPVQPLEIAVDEALVSVEIVSAEDNGQLTVIGLPVPGEALPASGKSLPPGAIKANPEAVISISALAADGEFSKNELFRQSKLPQVMDDADSPLMTMSRERPASELRMVETVNVMKVGGVGESSQVKLNDFQMMQSAVAEVVELNASQARLQNPSAVVAAGNNPQNSLLLPTELETLSVNNTRDTTSWGNAVGERVHWMINQKLNTATIRLDPPSLGRLEVNIQVNDDATRVTINTQHAQTRDIIDTASFKLREFLQENGYQNVSVDVSHQEQHQQASKQTADDSGDSLAENQLSQEAEVENESGETSYFSSDSVVDYFV